VQVALVRECVEHTRAVGTLEVAVAEAIEAVLARLIMHRAGVAAPKLGFGFVGGPCLGGAIDALRGQLDVPCRSLGRWYDRSLTVGRRCCCHGME